MRELGLLVLEKSRFFWVIKVVRILEDTQKLAEYGLEIFDQDDLALCKTVPLDDTRCPFQLQLFCDFVNPLDLILLLTHYLSAFERSNIAFLVSICFFFPSSGRDYLIFLTNFLLLSINQ